ncbi:MAG: AraC family transcriptional regulator [Christensenellaceae bacterium]
MLASSDISITEIANELHYSSIHVFSRAFKNKFRLSPTDYRQFLISKRR